jgi:hypothetical protein
MHADKGSLLIKGKQVDMSTGLVPDPVESFVRVALYTKVGDLHWEEAA